MTQPAETKRYRLAIRRPVAMLMLFLTLVVFGWKSYQQLPINLMPNISYPTLTVRTEYEGAAPEDVEKLLSRPLEETLSIVSGLVEISSVSSPGLSQISLEFTWGTDMNTALQEVRDRLDLFDPPKEVTKKPIILRYDPSLDPVMRIAITGLKTADPDLMHKELTTIREAAERHMKSDLEAEPGVAQAQVKGGREEEIQVRVDGERLASLGLSYQDVVNSLAQQNINLSGGRLREGKTEYLVRTLNEFRDIESIRNCIVGTAKVAATSATTESAASVTSAGVGTTSNVPSLLGGDRGPQIRLADVAAVFNGEKERETIVHINGQEAVAIDIFKEGDANTVQVCNRLKDVLGFPRTMTFSERLTDLMTKAQETSAKGSAVDKSGSVEQRAKTIQSRLPSGAKFTLISDQSRFIKGSIKEAQDSAIQGGLFALLVIFLFLHKVSSTVIIGLAIPISLITAFIPMFMAGITLNVMSLGGLALAVGHLVDDSIIVLESIYRCAEEGDTGNDAIERGVREIFSADVSTTVTNVVVFLPIVFVQGIAGQIFGDFGFTMTFSLLASLLTALYLDPMLASLRKLRLDTAENVVWAVRAYRAARDEEARGRVAAVLNTLPAGVAFGADWLKQTAIETFGPALLRFSATANHVTFGGVIRSIFRVAELPFLVLLFLMQMLLKMIASVLIMALFILSVVMIALVWVLRRIFRVVLWLPLTVFNVLFGGIRNMYARSLRLSLKYGPVVLLIAALLAAHSVYLTRFLGRELIPPLRQGEFSIRMEAPPGTRLEETERRASKIEKVVLDNPNVSSVGVEIGMEKNSTKTDRGENIAQFNVLLKNPESSVKNQDNVIRELRDQITTASSDQVTFALPTLFSFKTAVELQIRGDDYEELKRVGKRALEAVKDIQGLKDAELSVKRGYPEIIIELDRDLLAARGIVPSQVAQLLRTKVQGDVATKFSRGGEKIDIRVRADKSQLQNVQDLRSVSVTDSDPPIPLSSVAKISIQDGPSEIRRIDQRQVVLVRGNVEGFDLGSVTGEIEQRLRHVEKPADYSFVLGGQNRELRTSYKSLQFALLLSIFLVYVVMACQFESLIQPALIMFTIPLGFIGVIDALYLIHMPLSIAVFMGGILLVGIVVNNSMLLVDYANQLQARGRTKRQAIYESGLVRFRPVLMTAITTIVGAVPMAISSGEGAELRRPLAVTVISGLSIATLLTLVIIPVVYDLFSGRGKQKKVVVSD